MPSQLKRPATISTASTFTASNPTKARPSCVRSQQTATVWPWLKFQRQRALKISKASSSREARRLIDAADGDIDIEVSDTKIVVRAGRAVLTSKLIDGSFPDYSRVIPKGNDKKLVVENKAFEAAVDRVSTVSAERSRSVKMSLSEGKLALAVSHAETGAGNAETVEFMFNAPASPALVLDPSDDSARYVLMPLRV